MPRAKSLRTLMELPLVKGFKPMRMRSNGKEPLVMALEEYEVLRLIDYLGMIHEEAAKSMNVSRSTVTRIYDSARKKLSTALVEGRAFVIQGGEIEIKDSHYMCEDCRQRFIIPMESEQGKHCPQCKSEKLISLSDCFTGGCRRCRRCR